MAIAVSADERRRGARRVSEVGIAFASQGYHGGPTSLAAISTLRKFKHALLVFQAVDLCFDIAQATNDADPPYPHGVFVGMGGPMIEPGSAHPRG